MLQVKVIQIWLRRLSTPFSETSPTRPLYRPEDLFPSIQQKLPHLHPAPRTMQSGANETSASAMELVSQHSVEIATSSPRHHPYLRSHFWLKRWSTTGSSCLIAETGKFWPPRADMSVQECLDRHVPKLVYFRRYLGVRGPPS